MSLLQVYIINITYTQYENAHSTVPLPCYKSQVCHTQETDPRAELRKQKQK